VAIDDTTLRVGMFPEEGSVMLERVLLAARAACRDVPTVVPSANASAIVPRHEEPHETPAFGGRRYPGIARSRTFEPWLRS
jgi:hypothetical protein